MKKKSKVKQKQKQKQTVIVKIDNSRKTTSRPRTSNPQPTYAHHPVVLQPQIHVSQPQPTFHPTPAPAPVFNPTPEPKQTFQPTPAPTPAPTTHTPAPTHATTPHTYASTPYTPMRHEPTHAPAPPMAVPAFPVLAGKRMRGEISQTPIVHASEHMVDDDKQEEFQSPPHKKKRAEHDAHHNHTPFNPARNHTPLAFHPGNNQQHPLTPPPIPSEKIGNNSSMQTDVNLEDLETEPLTPPSSHKQKRKYVRKQEKEARQEKETKPRKKKKRDADMEDDI